MKLTAKVRLQPTQIQHQLLVETLKLANATCNHISQVAWQAKTFKQFALHRLVYQEIRAGDNPLSGQMVVRAIATVADGYKLDQERQRTFKPLGGFAYDSRLGLTELSWKLDQQSVSIWTIAGRQTMPCVAGPRQLELLQGQRGASDRCYRNGAFYLSAAGEVTEPTAEEVEGLLGVDLGIVNIATASDGHPYSGSQLLALRKRRRRQRRRLPAKGTKSARSDRQTPAESLERERKAIGNRCLGLTDPYHQQANRRTCQRHRPGDCRGGPHGHPRPGNGSQATAGRLAQLVVSSVASLSQLQGPTAGGAGRPG